MSASGTHARTWLGTACRVTLMIHPIGDIHSVSSVMSVTWTMMSCSSTCAVTTTSATSVTRMGPRTTIGGWVGQGCFRGGAWKYCRWAGPGVLQGAQRCCAVPRAFLGVIWVCSR